ncbi:hypothetical protein ACHAXR_003170 [Thalassiosira sp. AJA248-18]
MKHRHHQATHQRKYPFSPFTLLQIIILVTISNSNSFQLFSYTNFNRAAPHRRPSTDVLWASPPPQFEEGEEVVVTDDDDGATHNIGVVEMKKGGWYTICLKRDSSRVKRRGSQLQQTKSGSNDTSSTTYTTTHLNSEGDGKQSLTTPVNILDLDCILRSIQQNYPEHSLTHNKLNTTNHKSISPDTIDQITNCHSQYSQWIIFSDLHVMPSTLSTCLEILDTVHNTACRANAGILFLGDFWHHRGFVRVDCLNAVLDTMSKWTVPCIMIPGNHDQIDWKGLEHALTPLSNSYRIISSRNKAVDDDSGDGPPKQYAGPLIISQPTKFLDALFVPHIRDKAMMESILSSKEAASSSALFVHADVKGASMNDLIQSQHGLTASLFPADKHIYSGHFHKPHEVKSSKGISIRYVGSPYQTSFSEAGQAKSLLQVDSLSNWQCIEEIPINIGPRFHRVSSVQRLLEFSSAKLRQGDKVAVTVCQHEIEEMRIHAANNKETTDEKSQFDIKLDELREVGITVEIRDSQPQSQDAAAAGMSPEGVDEQEIELEDLSPKATLAAYLDNEVENDELGEATANMVLGNGVELLRDLIDAAANDTSQSLNSPPNEAKVTELEIESVSVLGFGSFRQETVYPLRNRGVVLLRGTNKDGSGR